MVKLKVIIRNILSQKLNSGIILVSLALGIACVNLIAMFIDRELNTDGFHTGKDRIYALTCDDPWEPGGRMYYCRFGSAEYMNANFTQVEDFCRFENATPQKVIANNEAYFDRPQVIAVSKNFFDFFSYKLLYGGAGEALESEDNIVISEELARKYFGSRQANGQIITLVSQDKEEQMVVTGVFQKPIESTQISFDMVRPIGERDSRCYVKLSQQADQKTLEKLFEANKNSIPVVHAGTPGAYYLKPLQKVYFDTSRRSQVEASRDENDLWIAAVIGLIIIVIASFNYLGLINNKLLEKKKTYTIQRVNGGSKSGFVLSFLTEQLVIISLAFALSLFLMLWMMPFFNELTDAGITPNFIFTSEKIPALPVAGILLLALTWLFVQLKIKAEVNIDSLKPSGNPAGKYAQIPVFNIFQLAGVVALIVCSFTILKQISFITHKPIGLDKGVIEIKVPAEYAHIVPVFKEKLIRNASVEKVSVASASPVLEHFLVLLKYEQNGEEKEYAPAGFGGDENYISTLGIRLIEGAGFSGNPETDVNKCLINSSLAKLFPDQDLIGRGLPGMEDKIVTGIVDDFHYLNLKSAVAPAFISYKSDGRHLMVKSSAGNNARTAIDRIWEQLIPDYPVNQETINDRYEWLHRENKSYVRLIGACCLISVFLSMIGLFAISFQSSRYRTKEIGIRKVNGAKVWEVLGLLNKDFVKWVVIAFAIASPLAWYAMKKWLENFAYKTELSWWIFALAGVMALGIALLTVSWQSWKAATRNPVEALRYE